MGLDVNIFRRYNRRMKAWILPEQAAIEAHPLQFTEIDTPQPEPGEIKIAMKACGVCRTDLHIAEGDLPLKKAPLILGHEIAGQVDMVGAGVDGFSVGDRIGAAWLHDACGQCEFCRTGRENLCPHAQFTGWDVDGGFAEYTVVKAEFAFPLGDRYQIHEYASFMCPGIAGYRAFRLAQLQEGATLGLYGFGITATYVLQIAQAKGIRVFVVTRSHRNQSLARTLGADWVGDYTEQLPGTTDAGIIFPPVGHLVAFGLAQLTSGGRLILAPVTMSPIEIPDYNDLWQERSIISLAHITRRDAHEFLELTNKISFEAPKTVFSLDELPEVLLQVKHGEILGNAVIEFPEARNE